MYPLALAGPITITDYPAILLQSMPRLIQQYTINFKRIESVLKGLDMYHTDIRHPGNKTK